MAVAVLRLILLASLRVTFRPLVIATVLKSLLLLLRLISPVALRASNLLLVLILPPVWVMLPPEGERKVTGSLKVTFPATLIVPLLSERPMVIELKPF